MYKKLTENIAKTIKTISKVIYIICLILAVIAIFVAIIGGIICINEYDIDSFEFVATAGGGLLSAILLMINSIISSTLLYGFAELIESK